MPCTYYAAPMASDGGRVPEGEPFAARYAVGTPDAPIPVSDFWKRKLVKPGTVLCLKDGVYRGDRSMLKPPSEAMFSGTSEAPVEIRAVNDGAVWIDGEFERATLRLLNLSYWTVEGLNAYNSRGAPVRVGGRKQEGKHDQVPAHHVVLRRVVAWRDFLPYGSTRDYDAIGGENQHVFSIADVSDVLLEDCAGFGWGRKIFENYRSKRVVMRRIWARWDGRYPYEARNKFAFSCSNQSYDAICENLIATVGGSRVAAAQPADYQPGVGLIATDGSAGPDARWLEPGDRDRHAINLRIYGSLAYAPSSSPLTRIAGFRVGGGTYPSKGQKGALIEDSVAAISGAKMFAANLANCDDDPQKHPDGCSWQLQDDRARSPVLLRHVTLLAGHEPVARIGKDWSLDDVRLVPWSQRKQVDIYRGTGGGASICHRYVDGRETPVPLWPWPMQERIRAATERSSWPTADVIGEISEVFGPPPPECIGS